ncbi:MAG: metallophosphoesterase [Candidatus Fermentibacteraceae bacterium]|nr:metallophosphoesterase [Candidatus Fermentibacteraceae bacterium]
MRYILFVFTIVTGSYAVQCYWDGVGRVVAVGDVHGDLGQFVKILEDAGIVDDEMNWIGGKTHLVQIGDVLDRGPDSRAVMDLLISLEQQAPLQGGCVHFLLGNHEIMLMKTDLRYVHPGEIDSYGGLKEMVRALRPGGEYGSWLAGHNTVIRINNALFVHAGISADFASFTADSINSMVRREISSNWSNPSGVLSSTGPVWYRGLAQDRGSEVTEVLEEALAVNSADIIVIGHTVTIEGITTRFSGRVVMIDAGMSECYGGTAQYLELDSKGYKVCLL